LSSSSQTPKKALVIFGAASPYELGLPSLSYYNWPNLYAVYVRGEAYLAAHQGGRAAAEFQKILDHRGIVLNEPIGVLAHLQLGRAYALQGDLAKSRVAYKDFLALWRDADPDIPILSRHPHPEGSQSRVREATVRPSGNLLSTCTGMLTEEVLDLRP
jgi:eukaryotic-like serine/threonine-protein kinase